MGDSKIAPLRSEEETSNTQQKSFDIMENEIEERVRGGEEEETAMLTAEVELKKNISLLTPTNHTSSFLNSVNHIIINGDDSANQIKQEVSKTSPLLQLQPDNQAGSAIHNVKEINAYAPSTRNSSKDSENISPQSNSKENVDQDMIQRLNLPTKSAFVNLKGTTLAPVKNNSNNNIPIVISAAAMPVAQQQPQQWQQQQAENRLSDAELRRQKENNRTSLFLKEYFMRYGNHTFDKHLAEAHSSGIYPLL